MPDADFSLIQKISPIVKRDLETLEPLHKKFKHIQNNMVKKGLKFGEKYAKKQLEIGGGMVNGIKIVDGFCPNNNDYDIYIENFSPNSKQIYQDDIKDLVQSHPDCDTNKKRMINDEKCRLLSINIKEQLAQSWIDASLFSYINVIKNVNKNIEDIEITDDDLRSLKKLLKISEIEAYKALDKSKKDIFMKKLE